jgi:fucose permease
MARSRRSIGGSSIPKYLAYLMFMMFAMTTDSVGVIIPELIKRFHLSMTAAGAFQYASMAGIALSGLGLGFLADRLGRKATIILGLSLFAVTAFAFLAGSQFSYFVTLLFVAGAAIGLFKTGALALIGDLSTSTAAHTRTMNMVEGFFAVGAIIGPAIVTRLLLSGASWKWLYAIAGTLCLILIGSAWRVRYPQPRHVEQAPARPGQALKMLRDPFCLAFSAAAMLYVGVEAAIYVWMPTLLKAYHGSLTGLSAYALTAFFVLRAAGRFLGAFMLARLRWTTVLAVASGAVFACFAAALIGGIGVAVIALPACGLFMSVIYPTLNSKGISCFAKAKHGAVGGVILFFTCVSAIAAPLAMGAISDRTGNALSGFMLAAGLAGVLFAGLVFNAVHDPSARRLGALDASEYV